MAKGSKKYASHEYSFTSPAKSGLGKELDKQKSAAAHSRRDTRTYPRMAEGGAVPTATPVPAASPSLPGAASFSESFKKGGGSSAMMGKAHGGEIKKKDNRKDIGDDNKAGSLYEMESSLKNGGEIKAKNKDQKAEVKGDSEKNDKIPILASEGEFMIKRSIMKSKDAPKKAAAAIKKEKDKKKK